MKYSQAIPKVAMMQHVSRQFLSAKHAMRRNKKAVSMFKLVLVSGVCLLTFGFYAINVSASSTEGWKLKEVQKNLKNQEFDFSIAKLDVLQLESELFEENRKQHNFWYDREDAIVVVDMFEQPKAVK